MSENYKLLSDSMIVDRHMVIPNDDLPLILEALQHRADYLVATKRDDRLYRDLLERLQRKQWGVLPSRPKAGRSFPISSLWAAKPTVHFEMI